MSFSCILPLTLGDTKEDTRKKNNKKWKQMFWRDLIFFLLIISVDFLMEQSRWLKVSNCFQPLIPAKF